MEEYLTNMIEGLILRIPEAMTILLVILYYLKGIKKKTSDFDLSVDNLKERVSSDFSTAKGQIEQVTKNAINQLNNLVQKQLEETKSIMEEHKAKIDEYHTIIDDLKKENEYNLIVSNAMIEVLVTSLGKDHDLINSGLSSELVPKLQNVIDNVNEDPDHKLENIPIFEDSLKKIYNVLGEENFKRLLNKVNLNEEES